MPQLDEAGAGSEVDIDATAPDTSEAEAEQTTQTPAEALYADDQPQADEGEEQLDAEESDDDEAEEEAEAVNAPASLTPEEKEKFAQLPPEAQRVFSETLARRDREIQQGLESARSAQRDAERTAADQVAQTQRDFAQRTQQVIAAFQPQPPTPPPAHLAQQNLAEYMVMRAQYDEAFQAYQQDAAAYEQMVSQLGELGARSEQHFTQRDQAWMQEEFNKLRSIPEFADEAQRPEFTRQITDLGKELGFSDEELANVSAKDIFALNTARKWKAGFEKWQAHQKKRNERPRAVGGRFSAAPVGNAGTQKSAPVDPLKALYPND